MENYFDSKFNGNNREEYFWQEQKKSTGSGHFMEIRFSRRHFFSWPGWSKKDISCLTISHLQVLGKRDFKSRELLKCPDET